MQIIGQISEKAYSWRRKLATVGVTLVAAYVGFIAVFGANGWLAYHQKRTEFRKLQQEVQQIQTENERIQQQIKALRTDPSTIEKEAREQLRYAKPGEVIYVMPARKPQQQTGVAQNGPAK